MSIKTRNKQSAQFSTASMSDLVFLLLIFFMITSTLVSPNAVKLLLPNSTSKTIAKQSFTVYINDKTQFFVEETPSNVESLESILGQKLSGQNEATVVLRADKIVPVQYIVNVIDAINSINNKFQTKHKVILATSPKK